MGKVPSIMSGTVPTRRQSVKIENMEQIIERRRYRTEDATVLASDCYWDGHNWERRGRNVWLLRTPKGAYFAQHQTQWQAEQDTIEALSIDEAIDMFETLPEHAVAWSEAFPGEALEDA